jgi:hypothetical protein
MGIEITPPGPATPLASGASITSSGTQTGPAAFTSICGPVGLSAGTYDIKVYFAYSGTMTAAELNNIRVVIGAANQGFIPVANVVSNNPMSPFYQCQGVLAAAGSILLQNIAAAGAAAVYNASVVVTRVA